jgi:hypothetical protein
MKRTLQSYPTLIDGYVESFTILGGHVAEGGVAIDDKGLIGLRIDESKLRLPMMPYVHRMLHPRTQTHLRASRASGSANLATVPYRLVGPRHVEGFLRRKTSRCLLSDANTRPQVEPSCGIIAW